MENLLSLNVVLLCVLIQLSGTKYSCQKCMKHPKHSGETFFFFFYNACVEHVSLFGNL